MGEEENAIDLILENSEPFIYLDKKYNSDRHGWDITVQKVKAEKESEKKLTHEVVDSYETTAKEIFELIRIEKREGIIAEIKEFEKIWDQIIESEKQYEEGKYKNWEEVGRDLGKQ